MWRLRSPKSRVTLVKLCNGPGSSRVTVMSTLAQNVDLSLRCP